MHRAQDDSEKGNIDRAFEFYNKEFSDNPGRKLIITRQLLFMNYLNILRNIVLGKNQVSKEFLSLIFNHLDYIPTATKALTVLQSGNLSAYTEPIESKIKEVNPFYDPKERTELIERANWLCDKLIVKDPEEIINLMPKIIGRNYKGEWAIYACSMTAFALCNLIRLYPELRHTYIEKVSKLINIVNTPIIRYYDSKWWNEDAIETLPKNQGHMTYLSILAWMIGNYKLIGGDNRYDDFYEVLCETLNRRILLSRDCNLPSFPNGIVFFPDMMFALIALKDYGKINNNKYNTTIEKWILFCKNNYLNKKTGLLWSLYYANGRQGRTSGAYTGLNTTCLVLIDEKFAREQFKLMKKHLIVSFGKYSAMKEFLNRMPKFSFDIDAGPIVFGLSPSGTAFALGAATYFEDWELRKRLLNMAELAGNTVHNKNTRHYKLAEIMLTGEAITLAMRTFVKP